MGIIKKSLVVFFGIIEIALGSFTLIMLLISLIFDKPQKPPEVFLFVLTTSIISAGLGIGILRRNLSSYHLLLFFATVIILSKLLIFAKIITLSGALETSMPTEVKNLISIFYHSLLIWYFTRPSVKEYFGERRDALFSIKIPFTKHDSHK